MELELFIILVFGGGFLLTCLLQFWIFVADQIMWLRAYNYSWKTWWKNRNFL